MPSLENGKESGLSLLDKGLSVKGCRASITNAAIAGNEFSEFIPASKVISAK